MELAKRSRKLARRALLTTVCVPALAAAQEPSTVGQRAGSVLASDLAIHARRSADLASLPDDFGPTLDRVAALRTVAEMPALAIASRGSLPLEMLAGTGVGLGVHWLLNRGSDRNLGDTVVIPIFAVSQGVGAVLGSRWLGGR